MENRIISLVFAVWMGVVPGQCLASEMRGGGHYTVYDLPYFWVEDNGNTTQLSEWKGKQTIITMAYGDCTRICSSTLRKLEEIQDFLHEKNMEAEFIIVSYDPKTDTPQSWFYYRKNHGLANRKNWHFLSGSDASTRRLAGVLGMQYWRDEDHIIHDFKILRLNTDGSIRGVMDWDHQKVATLFND